MSSDWGNRHEKETARAAIFDYLKSKNRSLGSYVGLPGWDGKVGGRCIRCGIEKGVITPKTKVLGFEVNPGHARRIQKDFASMPNVRIKAGLLEDSKLKPGSVDFAFLDFGASEGLAAGTIDSRLYLWLGKVFAPSLRDGSSFAITLPLGRRTGRLFESVSARLRTDLKPYAEFMEEKFPAIWLDQPTVGTWLFIIKCALRSRQNTLRDILYYRDNGRRPMLVFLFDDVEPSPAGYPALSLQIYRKETTMADTTRSRAAVKAHATRRANALFAKRSAAAKKAWRTRRERAV